MRRASALIVCLVLAAAPAFAEKVPGGLKMKPAPVFKPRQSEEPPAPPPVIAAPPAPLISRAPAAVSGSQCRARCSRTYYFCASGGDEECAGTWSQCAAACPPV